MGSNGAFIIAQLNRQRVAAGPVSLPKHRLFSLDSIRLCGDINCTNMNGISQPTQAVPSAVSVSEAQKDRAFWPGFLLALAATSIAVGIIWDISWHISIGRDTFWTPA